MTVLIVDDDRVVRQALKTILEQLPDVEVLALGESAEEAVQLYDAHQPDILLMDIRMGEQTGLDAAKRILSKYPQARILFLTTFLDEGYIRSALQMGAKGYLLKQDYEHIGPALTALMSGQTVFGSDVMQTVPALLKQPAKANGDMDLTEREAEVLRLCADGLSNKEIADALFLSEGTVRNYISQLLQKHELRDRTQLVVKYYKDLKK